jgi:hypothetical protein
MSRLRSISWGTIPEFPAFKAHVEAASSEDGEPVIGPPGDVYHMELVGQDVTWAKMALEAMFAAGIRVSFEQFKGRHGKYGLRFLDLQSLHKFIAALMVVDEMEAEEDPDADRQETAGNLASSIMTTLGYEWI